MKIPVVVALLLGVAIASQFSHSYLVGAPTSWVFLALAVGLIAATTWLSRDDRVRRRLVDPRVIAGTALFAVGSAVGVRMGAGLWLHRGLALMAAAGCGFSVTYALLYAGVQRTLRLFMISALWCGVAVTVFLAGQDTLDPATLPILGAAAMVTLASFTASKQVRAVDMAAPIPEPWHAGPVSLVASALFGGGAYLIGGAVIPESQAWRAACTISFVIGTCVGPWRAPRARRAWIQLGSFTLLMAGTLAVCVLLARSDLAALSVEPSGRVGLVIGWALIGMAAPYVARLYSRVPLGSNVLSEIPSAELRAPIGAPVSVAVACLGAVAAARGWIGDSRDHGLWLLVLAGVLWVSFDPRSGAGRKSIALVSTALPVVITVAWAIGVPWESGP